MNSSAARRLEVCAIVAIAWGALAFGGVYPWAYGPLALLCAAIGLLALFAGRAGRPPLKPMGVCLGLLAFVIGLQLVPLPRAALISLSPGADHFLRSLDFSYAIETAELGRWRPLSIAPAQTALGLMLFASFALFVLGLARVLSVRGARVITISIIAIGVGLALIGIAQLAAYPAPTPDHPTRIYGFWKPRYFSFPFGPFVNRNHFAGWIVMALPLCLSFFYDALQRSLERSGAYRRDAFAFVGSHEFGALASSGVAAALMGVALAMTRSRSGLIAFAFGSALAALFVVRKQPSVKRRIAVAGCFLALLVVTAQWAGVETVVAKFTEDARPANSLGGRAVIWSDSARIVRDFAGTGAGLNSYGTAMVRYQSAGSDVHYNEAHNDYLQLAAEGGLLLGIPALACLVALVLQTRRRFREAPADGSTYWIRVGAVIGLLSIGTQEVFEFSLQMPGNAALFAVLVAIALHRSPRVRTPAAASFGPDSESRVHTSETQ